MRLVIQNQKHDVLRDSIVELPSININIIDRPALILLVEKNTNGYCNLLYKYSSLKEDTLDVKIQDIDIFLVVGVNSGCFYSVTFRPETYSWINLQMLCKQLSEEHKSTSRRFQDNLKEFSRLTKNIIEQIPKLC